MQRIRIYLILFLVNITFGIFTEYIVAQHSQLKELVYTIEGLSDTEIEELTQLLEHEFQQISTTQILNDSALASVKSVISAGLFDQAQFAAIADVAYKVYISEINGAPIEYVEDLALIGFSYSITQLQLEMAAKSIQLLNDNNVDTAVIEEFISHGIYNAWNGNIIMQAARGLLEGTQSGLNAKRVALSIIIGIEQDGDKKNIQDIIVESIQFLKELKKKPAKDANRKEIAYQYREKAVTNGVPATIADEIYKIAIDENWDINAIKAVFDGLIKGRKLELTIEKLATAFVIRMAQGLENVSPEKMVADEINYIKQVEKQRLDVINNDKKLHKRKQKPIYQNQMSNIQPTKDEKPQQKKPVTYYPTTTRKSINEQLMWQTIREYLGPPPTPYRWGGVSKRGIDCSGFTQSIYKIQGLYIPRTSRQQFATGMTIVPNQLKFGDLIFFSKYFNNYITHVGIYLGNGSFVHSSSSSGVTISSLNKSYYRARYRGARRIVY